MMNLISAIDDLNFGEALVILVVGMLVIMAVLSVLIGLLYIIRYAVNALEKPKKVKATEAAATPSEEIVEDEETVAAITAAISCILQEESNVEGTAPVAPFVIKKIKHIR